RRSSSKRRRNLWTPAEETGGGGRQRKFGNYLAVTSPAEKGGSEASESGATRSGGGIPPSLRKGSSAMDEGDGPVVGVGGSGVGGGGVGTAAARTNRIIATVNANAESAEETARARSALELAAVAHLELMVRQLVAASSGIDASRRAEWSRTIATLVQQARNRPPHHCPMYTAVSTVEPNVKAADQMDIRPYVKTKLVPGGRREECRYVDGVVFRQNVTHKAMPKGVEIIIERPRLLVLSGGIEYQRGDKFTNLNQLRESEERRIEIAVEKIVALRPHLLLVGKTVCHVAQKLLREREVVLVQNVKTKTLERIARLVGARVLPSVDQIIDHRARGAATHDQNVAGRGMREEMGLCGRFSVKTFASPGLEACVASLKPQSGAAEGEKVACLSLFSKECASSVNAGLVIAGGLTCDGSNWMRSWVPEKFRGVRGRGGVTYVFLEGCHKRLGCTLVRS
ncbi:unnamed protein product, partial [Sphacelaria rigidula]